jgi:hypothetical protein
MARYPSISDHSLIGDLQTAGSRWRAGHGGCRRGSCRGCWTTPRGTGAPGCTAPPTPAAGGRCEQLGNFPQAFSHLSLINAAINLGYQLDHGPGEVSPVLARIRRMPTR